MIKMSIYFFIFLSFLKCFAERKLFFSIASTLENLDIFARRKINFKFIRKLMMSFILYALNNINYKNCKFYKILNLFSHFLSFYGRFIRWYRMQLIMSDVLCDCIFTTRDYRCNDHFRYRFCAVGTERDRIPRNYHPVCMVIQMRACD